MIQTVIRWYISIINRLNQSKHYMFQLKCIKKNTGSQNQKVVISVIEKL